MNPESVLLEAQSLIYGDRHGSYGKASEDFAVTAEFWNLYLRARGIMLSEKGIEDKDVAVMMTLLKIRREAFKHKRDNIVDACGYLALGNDIENEGSLG